MSSVWGFIEGIGGLVGLATGLFVVWDRFFRMTPVAVIVARPLVPGGMAKGLYLQVRNRSDRPILVNWRNGDRKGRFGVAEGHSTKEIIASIVNGETVTVIEPEEAKELVLFRPVDVSAIDPDNRIEADIYWRYAQPKIWQRGRHIRISIPKRSLMILHPEDYDMDSADGA